MRAPTRIVEILRDFLEVHRLIRQLVERHRSEGLRFPQVAELIGDDESSVLFRLKERSHAVFRGSARGARALTPREALFDLAVGSLFHEAMKLRENLYQREVYGPRVRELLSEAREESKALFDEFERMLGSVGERLDEGVRELEALVQRTADQLRLLLGDSADAGGARFVTERAAEVETVFGTTLHALLEEMFGSTALGFEHAGRSHLASGSFAAAVDHFESALAHAPGNPEVTRLCDYALGMRAYLARDYAGSVARLAKWADGAAPHPELLPLARDAVSSIIQLAEGDDGTVVSGEASELLARLGGAALRSRLQPRQGPA